MMYKKTLPLLIFLITSSALAGVVCEPASQFKEQIYNCGMNGLAAQKAASCAKALIAEAQMNSAKLAKAMQEAQKSFKASQTNSMKTSVDRLESGISEIEKTIASLQKNTDVISIYTTEAMIDFSDGTDDDSSADCYSDSFHAIEKVIKELDKHIVSAKKARDAADQLVETLEDNDSDLGSVPAIAPTVADGETTAPAKAVKVDPKKKVGGSTISGELRKDEVKK